MVSSVSVPGDLSTGARERSRSTVVRATQLTRPRNTSSSAVVSGQVSQRGTKSLSLGLVPLDPTKWWQGTPPSFMSDEGLILAAGVFYSPITSSVVSAVIFFNLVVIIMDTDARAQEGTADPWIEIAGDLCFGFYVIEFAARLFIERRRVFREPWNRLDFLVLAFGFLEKALSSVFALKGSTMQIIRVFRAVRLLRLMHAFKVLAIFRELRKLLTMIVTCSRTLCWSFVLTFFVMTIWSVLLVEFVSPVMAALDWEQERNSGGVDFARSYSTVMRANLSLFQTIVSGDQWGEMHVPVIVAHPWTALIFIPAQLSLVYGVLNLVVAIVVDTFADIREQNLQAMSMEKDEEEHVEKAALSNIFKAVDSDDDGSVTFAQIEAGIACLPELRQRLRIMDVNRDDLVLLCRILDEDGSGDMNLDELIDMLYRTKCTNVGSATSLVKSYVTELLKKHDQMEDALVNIEAMLSDAVVRGQVAPGRPHNQTNDEEEETGRKAVRSHGSCTPYTSGLRHSSKSSSRSGSKERSRASWGSVGSCGLAESGLTSTRLVSPVESSVGVPAVDGTGSSTALRLKHESTAVAAAPITPPHSTTSWSPHATMQKPAVLVTQQSAPLCVTPRSRPLACLGMSLRHTYPAVQLSISGDS